MIRTYDSVAVLLALAAVGRARRRSRRRRLPHAAEHPGSSGTGGEFRQAHAGRTGRESRDVCEGSGEARCLGGQRAAAEFRHRICRAARAGADAGGPRRRSSASASSMRSIIRCCAITAPRWSISRPIDSTILPYKGDPNDTTATVRTEVKRSSGDKVPVNFSLRKTDGVEGLGRRHRRHFLRQEFPHRFRLGNPAEGSG